MINDSLTQDKYREVIETQAEIAIDHAEDGDPLEELVWEGVDSSQYIVYTQHHLDILRYSEVGPQEWKQMVSDGDSWKEVIQTMVFDAMYNDVWKEVRRRKDE